MSKTGLGSGLGALFGDDAMDDNSYPTLPIVKIEPRADQPRAHFDEDALCELSDSIREHGIIQPIVVRELDGGYYQIIAGERRWRAARMAGLAEVPVRILQTDDRETAELALIENLQREDLNPVEEARGYRALMDNYGLTQEMTAIRVGKSRPVIANSLRLLSLPSEVLSMLEDGSLSLSHARTILEAPDAEIQRQAANITAEKHLTVRETAALVKRLLAGVPEKRERKPADDGVDYMAEVEKELTRTLGRRVKVVSGKRKGRFEIDFYGADDFEAVREALMSVKNPGGGADA